MNPYGSGDGKEMKTFNDNEKKYEDLFNNNMKDVKKTNKLIQENIELSQNIYDKLEKGERGVSQHHNKPNGIIPRFLKKTNSTVVKLFGLDNKESENIIYTMDDINYNDDYYKRKHSDSDESQMDFNVCGGNNSII